MHVLKDQSSVTAKDITIHAGDKVPDASAFGASATDEDGKAIGVTVDTSKVNNEVAGTYPVKITAADGQTKEVNVIVLPKETPDNGNDSNHNGQNSDNVNDSNHNGKASDNGKSSDHDSQNKETNLNGNNQDQQSKENSNNNQKSGTLPNTGQQNASLLELIGASILGFLGLIGFKKFKKN